MLIFHAIHLNVIIVGWRGKLALLAHLRLSHPLPHPDEAPYEAEDDYDANRDANDVGGDDTPAILPIVEEAVDIDALCRVGDEGETEVQGEDEDQPRDIDPERLVCAGDNDLEQGKEAVEAMLADIRPGVELDGEPGTIVKDDPIDDGDEERVCDDGGVEQGVEGLQRTGEAVEERAAADGVGQSVDGGEEKVERDAPVREDGEVREREADCRATAQGVVGAGPADDEESGDEGVEGLLRMVLATEGETCVYTGCV